MGIGKSDSRLGAAQAGEDASTTASESDRGDSRVVNQAIWKKVLKRPEAGALGGAILVYIFFFIVAPPFRDPAAFSTVLYQSASLGIPAVGVSLLMIGGEFDLTAGVAVYTSALVAAIFSIQIAGNVWAGVAVALLISLSIGWINGFLLIRTGMHSFLVTLSVFLMLQGLNIGVTKFVTGNVATSAISTVPGYGVAHAIFASSFMIGGMRISIIVFYWIALILLATWVLLRTKVGNWIFAVGGNGDSARAVGVPVRKMKIALYMIVGFTVWFLAMHILFAYVTVQSGAGVGNELLYIAAAVVGGCLLTGGYGSAVGSALGAFIFGMTTQGVIYAGWNSTWFMFFVGAMLLLATVFNTWLRLRAQRGK